MKRTLTVLVGVLLITSVAVAQNPPETNNPNIHKYPVQGWARPGGGGGQNLVFHNGGTVIRNANVVLIFWGPSFSGSGSDVPYANEIRNFRNQFGSTPEYNTITQYYGEDPVSGYGNIAQGSPQNQADWFDTSTPPTSVTDSAVQAKVTQYVVANGIDDNAVYEVFIPSASYSSDGGSTSCGGPNLAYCAYHGYFAYNGHNVKYSIEPYPSCSGCHANGFTVAQDQEHFVCHESREAVTDALLNAWFDRRGYEADDKCAWSPAPFIGTGGFGYQYEWSNAVGGCVKTR
jgi:hypothetical protein